MPNIALRKVPDQLHRELKAAAKRNHRSLNGEILARLAASVQRASVNIDDLLDRIRRRREQIGPLDLGKEALRKMKDAGRP